MHILSQRTPFTTQQRSAVGPNRLKHAAPKTLKQPGPNMGSWLDQTSPATQFSHTFRTCNTQLDTNTQLQCNGPEILTPVPKCFGR